MQNFKKNLKLGSLLASPQSGNEDILSVSPVRDNSRMTCTPLQTTLL